MANLVEFSTGEPMQEQECHIVGQLAAHYLIPERRNLARIAA
ncbi:MAG TPA: hypothetical protein VHM88_15875 [Candidatus Acidoferrales bacterium]|nr:hypothetical protein [Candidatus Acidoferrales bacterium]